MNKTQYANIWEAESKKFNSNKIYETLTKLIPDGKILEVGCGIGLGTYYLSQNHKILSLDNNELLIKKAKAYLDTKNNKYRIHNCDLFQLTENDKNIINQFKPNIIIGWFLGAGGELVNQYTPEETNIESKGKLYREKLEDIIISNSLLIDSVQTINLAVRVGRLKTTNKEEIYIAQKEDYDTYVFKNVGFQVTNVEIIDWNTENSDFPYSSVSNPNRPEGDFIPTILSITATRI